MFDYNSDDELWEELYGVEDIGPNYTWLYLSLVAIVALTIILVLAR